MDKQLCVHNKKNMKEKNHDLSRINAVADSKMISNNIVKMKNHKLLKICFFPKHQKQNRFCKCKESQRKTKVFFILFWE